MSDQRPAGASRATGPVAASGAGGAQARAEATYRWRVLAVVMVGTVMSALDASIVNVSLPNIMAAFGAGVDDIEWVITAYMLAFATFMPLTAWLRDRVGHRFLYLASLVVFTAGSVMCGLAWSLPALVVARVVQAIGGGAITPTGMAMIAEVFPPEERGRALGIWVVGAIVGPAIGPTLGGYLTETLGWRWIFNINLPIGVIGLVAASQVLRRDRPTGPSRRTFDLPGFALLATFLVSGLLALSKGNHEGWTSTYVVTCAVVAAFSLAAFLVVETTVEHRILELGLLRHGQFSVALLVTALRSVALYGGTFLLPLFMQNHMGLDEVRAGELLLPGALMIGLVSPIAGWLTDRVGTRALTVAGLTLTALFMFLYRDIDATTSVWSVLWPTLVRGVGLGLLVTPVTAAAMNAVPTTKAGMASSMLNLVQQVAGSVGIAALASVLGHRTTFWMASVGQGMNGHSSAAIATTAALAGRLRELGYAPTNARLAAGALLGRHAAATASVAAFDDAFLVGAGIVLLGIIPALWLAPRRRQQAELAAAHAE
jgi:DHA2 family multidrug resistance protein